MRQFNIDIFDRTLRYVFSSSSDINAIDDDYLSSSTNTVTVPLTHDVVSGQFIRLLSEDYSYFGVITDVEPGEYETTISFKSFITIFDEDILFNTDRQITSSQSHTTLEVALYDYIRSYYITTSDTYQRLPITISIDSSITQTSTWSFGIEPDSDTANWASVKLYSDLIVNALAMYGVTIDVEPIFSTRTIKLTITKRTNVFKIGADLENVKIKTLKYNNKALGTNKLVIYNSEDFVANITFYVHNDMTWDTDNRDRVSPVIREIRSVAPDSQIEDPTDAFIASALELAYSTLSGVAYDNLIELITYPDDNNIKPLELQIGQKVSVWYKGATYTSILTGKAYDDGSITLIFGSQRIEYSKRR